MDGISFEPLKYYTSVLKEKHKAGVEEHFNKLLAASRVNEAENRATVKKYDDEMLQVKKIAGKIKAYKVFFWILIVLGIIGSLVFIFGLNTIGQETSAGAVMVIAGLALALLGFLLAFLLIRRKIKSAETKKAKHQAMADKYYAEAMAQMSPLNALFDNLDTLRLIEKTMPEVKFDPSYCNDAERLLIEDYDYIDMTDEETSVIDTLSGKLFENPFLFERYVYHSMGTHRYFGSLVIRWTERYRDSKGNITTRTRVQTLHASVTKPKPNYRISTHLGYGSLAAPDLTFSRKESDTDELSEKALEKRIKKGEKKLAKKAEKAIADGGTFQEMANSEFDVLFGAHNRNHEVQFRLMYTPLAQNNTVDLLRSKEGYGDDFNIIKQGKFNIVKSNHAQKWDMDISASKYISHSVDISRERFISFNCEYFKSVYFDFAPLMAVPAYRDEPVASMKTPKAYRSYYTPYEHEALANAIGDKVFAHPEARTQSILKTQIIDRNGGIDRVAVTAYGYRTEARLDFVPTLGGDGRIHPVPVHWTEYIPVSRTSEMLLKSLGHSERELRQRGSLPYGSAYLHGILAYSPAVREAWERIEETFRKYT